MRILLLHHAPLDESEVGQTTLAWGEALAAAGHDAQILLVDRAGRRDLPTRVPVDRVTCSPGGAGADLPFEVPRYGSGEDGRGGFAFSQLSDAQLARYRDQFRRRLDTHIDRFNPEVLHVQYIGPLAQLALETGAPYVISSWGAELADLGKDQRLHALAEQAASSAGRILTPDAEVARRVSETFELDAERVEVAAPVLGRPGAPPAAENLLAAELVRVYRLMLDERFGGAR